MIPECQWDKSKATRQMCGQSHFKIVCIVSRSVANISWGSLVEMIDQDNWRAFELPLENNSMLERADILL